MKKKCEMRDSLFWNYLAKLVLIMKITTFFLLLFVVQLSANVYSQQTRLRVDFNQATLKEVMTEIERQTGLTFFYSPDILNTNQTVTLSSRSMLLDDILLLVSEQTGLSLKIVRDQIVVKKDLPGFELVNQQPRSVTGKVTDAAKTPLPGVTVIIKGTGQGTITDPEGEFSLSNIPANARLVFSFVGMKTQEIPVAGKPEMKVVMEEDAIGIEEVVAIGYGSVSRKDLVGSVASAKVTDMVKAPVPSFDQALAGRVAGVQVSSVDGQPGASINIVIRGANSITQDNSPLYIVDGFPIENNDNNSINPNDIESIDILKDASATAIYGARGANGVVMITTKRGKAGTPVVKYDGYYGFEYKTKKIAVLNPYEFVKLQLEINNDYATENYLANGKTLDAYRDDKGIDWYDRIMQKGQMRNHNLSVSGGTDKNKYSVSASIVDQDGIVRYSGFKRYQGRATLDQALSDKVKFGITVNYSESENYGTFVNNTQNSVSGALMYSVWSFRPIELESVGVDLEEELFDPLTDRTNHQVNPLVQLKNEIRETTSIDLFTNAYTEYLILKDLKLRITGGMSKFSRENVSFNNSKTRTGSPDYPLTLGVNGSQIFNESRNFSNENTLTYSKVFAEDHSLNVIGGYSLQTNKSSAHGASAIQIPNESLGISGLDEGTPQSVTASSSSWTLQSFYTRFMYSYRSKYILNLTMRADGSSKFATKNKWSYFPSIGLVYRMGEEDFVKNLSFISDAKIRASYGATGNNRVSDFSYLSSVTFPYGNFYSFGNAAPSVGGASGTLGNPDLKWETTKQYNVGLDLFLLKDRISFTGDYYYKRTDDLLLNAEIPSSSGYTQAIKNIGSVSNSGIELTLNTINIQTSMFRWNSNFNISFNKNEVISLTEGQESILSTSGGGVYQSIAKFMAKVGHPIALFYGTISEGLYPYSDFNQLTNGTYILKDDVPSNGTARNTIQPGHAKYKDLNGDGIVNSNDYTVIGNPNPLFVGGLTNNIEYKGFDLNVFFQFSYGNDVLNANRVLFEGGDNYGSNVNMYATYANRWSPENTDTDIPNRAGRGPQYWSTRYVEDASFLRLKTVSLGYTIPRNVLQTDGIKTLRVYASAQNLFTWTGYSGLDPEVSVRHSALTPGLDYSAYPRARTMTLGVNVTF
ncbi:MAG: TonB-dependent receptor [Mangrovibacterium sp.]